MHRNRICASIFTLVALAALSAGSLRAQDKTEKVADGGIFVDGWMGRADGGGKLMDSKLMMMDGTFHVITGPALAYWNPKNRASGDYTVKATFTEPKYMNLSGHPHPYGIMIAGNDLGTENQTYLYCAAYGNGRFIMRGFGPAAFQVSDRRPTAHEALNKAAGKGQPVTQEIAVSVKGDKVECAINGTVVGSYAKSDIVGEGKLKSTDGVFGIRAAHNVEFMVSGLAAEMGAMKAIKLQKP